MDKKVSSVLAGQMCNLPTVHSQIVRIFTSSTFTDTYVERNMLMKEIYPKLKEYCRNKHALDFQVVDMRWGVRDDASDDHMTTALCMEEIQNCQKLSVGPNFVAFLCQRYGYRPIPAIISAVEFEKMTESTWKGDDGRRVMETWYRKDANAIPPVYVLQKISSILPGYIADDEIERRSARKQWQTTFEELQMALRQAAKQCLSQEEQRKYFMSVTEEEIHSGMLQQREVDEHCMCFVRTIMDVTDNLQHEKAWRFIDMSGDALDTDAQTHMTDLRDSLVPAKLAPDNIYKSQVTWSAEENGIGSDAHAQYLTEFGDNFYCAVVKQVDKAVLHRNKLGQHELFLEVLQHLKLAKDRCEIFHGREDLLDKLQAIMSHDTKQPIVVHGQSGCGKTSIMAMAAQNVRQWITNGKNAVVVVRFLGTTPQSSSVMSVLTTICAQIAHNYKTEFSRSDVINTLVQKLTDLLNCVTAKKPLVIILDSLDQLSSGNYAHKLSWLPWQLPEHVHVIVSTLPEMYSILPNLRKRVQDGNFIRVQSLGDKLGMTILSSWLKRADRTLTQSQHNFVAATLKKCSLPLYTRLLYENVILWKSYTEATELPHSIRGIINALFERLEKTHGCIFVKHSLGYVTASKSGLSETELEDVLSLDDQVLTDVFQYHVPPVRRIPQLLIARLRHAIAHYVVNREADGALVIYWYHRQFIEAARDRYLDNEKTTQNIHTNLAHYFLGTWHGKCKDFNYTSAQAQKLGLKSVSSAEDRRVMPQPITYNFDDNRRHFNKRKLSNLPCHLSAAGMIDTLIEQCLLNFEWLRAKSEAFSLRQMLADFDYDHRSKICKTLLQSLNLARSTLSHEPNTLGCEILSRMLNVQCSDKDKSAFTALLQDAIVQGSYENALVPTQQIFSEIDDRLIYDLEHPELPTNWKLVALSPDGQTFYARVHPNELVVWDLTGGEIEKQIKLWPTAEPELNVMQLSYRKNKNKDSDVLFQARYAIFASSHQTEQNPVVVIDLLTAEIKHSIALKKFYPKLLFNEHVQLGYNNGLLILNAVGVECAVHDLENGECLHVFESKPTLLNVPETGKIFLFYIKQSKTIEVYSLASLEFLSEVSLAKSTTVPHKFLSSYDGTFVLNKNTASVTLWDFESTNMQHISGRELITYDFTDRLNGNVIFDMVLSSDFTLLLLCHKGGVLVWNVKTNTFVKECTIPDACVPEFHRVTGFKAAFVAGNTYVTAAFEGFVILWPVGKNSRKFAFYKASNDTNRILDVVPSTNPDFNAVVAIKERAKLFKVLDVGKVLSKHGFTPSVTLKVRSGARYLAPAMSCGKVVCRTYDSREVSVFDVTSGTMLIRDLQNREVRQPVISLDGRYVLLNTYNPDDKVRTQGENLRVYSTDTGKLVNGIPVSSLYLRTYTFSQSGDLVLTHSENSIKDGVELVLWKSNSQTQEKVQQMNCPMGGVSAVHCIYGDTLVITIHNYSQLDLEGEACDLRIFDAQTGSECHHSSGYVRDSLTPVAHKPYFFIAKAMSKNSNKICIFDVTTMKLQEKNIQQIGKMYIDKEGTRGVDTAVQVFDLMEGSVLRCFGDVNNSYIRQNPESYPKISQDGLYVAWFAIANASVHVASVETGAVIGQAFIHSTPLSLRLCYGNVLAVGSEEGYIMLFDIVNSAQDSEDACRKRLNIPSTAPTKAKDKSSFCMVL